MRLRRLAETHRLLIRGLEARLRSQIDYCSRLEAEERDVRESLERSSGTLSQWRTRGLLRIMEIDRKLADGRATERQLKMELVRAEERTRVLLEQVDSMEKERERINIRSDVSEWIFSRMSTASHKRIMLD
jgi:hypothetical protein